MNHFKLMFKSFLNEESGQDLIEYALVAALIGLASVSALNSLAAAVSSAMASIGSSITAAV
jgi:pilus assembly protein Flp/PilA